DLVTFDLMEDRNGDCQASAEAAVDFEIRRTQMDQQSINRSKWTNDMEDPLKTALDVPSIRRYMVLHSGLFHFVLAPVLYVVLWCAVFSTLHLYITVADYWVLILSVSLVSILLTTAIICILHHSNKEINVNIDVRLIQVNERMMKHKLMVGVADWVQNCAGHMQLYFVYWDMSYCLRTLCETLEEQSFVTNETQKTMKSRMSHLVLVTELPPINPEAGGSDVEQDSDENRPLLRNEDTGRSTPSSQRGDSKVTSNYSLVPEASLPAQAKAYQLLMTYSAAYVKLLMSERLSGPSSHRLRPLRSHCTTAPVCLCQYIKTKLGKRDRLGVPVVVVMLRGYDDYHGEDGAEHQRGNAHGQADEGEVAGLTGRYFRSHHVPSGYRHAHLSSGQRKRGEMSEARWARLTVCPPMPPGLSSSHTYCTSRTGASTACQLCSAHSQLSGPGGQNPFCPVALTVVRL
ncbi:hypothetical protein CCH79_00008629, partial [Gambusia affinis]